MAYRAIGNSLTICAHRRIAGMRTSIGTDDAPMSQAMAACGLPTGPATVGADLRLRVRLREPAMALEELSGLGWDRDHAQ